MRTVEAIKAELSVVNSMKQEFEKCDKTHVEQATKLIGLAINSRESKLLTELIAALEARLKETILAWEKASE